MYHPLILSRLTLIFMTDILFHVANCVSQTLIRNHDTSILFGAPSIITLRGTYIWYMRYAELINMNKGLDRNEVTCAIANSAQSLM